MIESYLPEYGTYVTEAEELDRALEKEVEARTTFREKTMTITKEDISKTTEILSNKEEGHPPINSVCFCVLAGTIACETCPNNPSRNGTVNVVTTTSYSYSTECNICIKEGND